MALLAISLVPRSLAQMPGRDERKELAKEADEKQDELINLEKETARALQMGNALLFQRVYGDDFIGILPSGEVLNKTKWILAIEYPRTKYVQFSVSDIRVRMFENTAVVTCLWSARGNNISDGRPVAKQSRVTHIYVYGQRGWQAVASQETLLPG